MLMEYATFGFILIFGITILSIIIHEVAHGLVAYFFGDKTAYMAGRLTLNPLPHIDIVGSVIIPALSIFLSGTLFGWAKPVPVNTRNFTHRFADFFVSAAGVLANLFLVIVGIIIAKVLLQNGALSVGEASVLRALITVNLSLFIFNLIPVPPFDGMAILQGLFPKIRFSLSLVHNPLYMIGAILCASFIYSLISPSIFAFVFSTI